MGKRPRILIIDDNVDLADNLREILEDEGLEVLVAYGGSHALEVLSAETVDLVLSDLKMPDLDGVEVLRYLKARWPALPVVIMTAFASDTLLAEAEAEGALAILGKPLDLRRLTDYVARITTSETPVLLVEDDEVLRGNLVAALRELAGVMPYPARDATTARRLAGSVAFRVAIVDIRLPDEDGVALGAYLRSRSNVEVIYITGYRAEIADLEALVASAGVTLLEKPFVPEDLLGAVRAVL